MHGTAWWPSCAYSKQDALPAVSMYDDFSLAFPPQFFTSAKVVRCLQSNWLLLNQQETSGFLVASPIQGMHR